MHRLPVPLDVLLHLRVLPDVKVGGRRRENGARAVRGGARASAQRRLHGRDRLAAHRAVGQRTRELQEDQDRVPRAAGE